MTPAAILAPTGPWTFNAENFDGVIRHTVATGPHTGRFEAIARHVSADNAALIASAPELLNLLIAAEAMLAEAQEALCERDDVCTDADGNDAMHTLRNSIQAAVAKVQS